MPPVSISRIILLLVPAVAIFWLWNTRYPPIREYKVYLTEDRKDAVLLWHELSEDLTEADLRTRFNGHQIRCMPDETRVPGVTRMCIVDYKSLNGVPTMTANFLFGKDGLKRVATSVPWWSHDAGYEALVAAYGQPHVSQDQPISGVRLHGWKLKSGSTVFYNRDRDRNPLEPSSTQWLSRTACASASCIQ